MCRMMRLTVTLLRVCADGTTEKAEAGKGFFELKTKWAAVK